jgi:hypothetical protein
VKLSQLWRPARLVDRMWGQAAYLGFGLSSIPAKTIVSFITEDFLRILVVLCRGIFLILPPRAPGKREWSSGDFCNQNEWLPGCLVKPKSVS